MPPFQNLIVLNFNKAIGNKHINRKTNLIKGQSAPMLKNLLAATSN